MNDKIFMLIERSSQNLQKISKTGKTILEGIFCDLSGEENKNGRIYTEQEMLPHLQYLQDDIKKSGGILGELDHPDKFEVSLANVSHRVIDLWYDQMKKQIRGKIELLDGTPKGQIAKSLLEAGVPLSISSRAAGSVNDDKTVNIQQIYTYDLVAKPGFDNAQLHTVNESANVRITNLINKINESYNSYEKSNISSNLGIINENISIIDLSDKYPSFKLREEARLIMNKNNENNMLSNTNQNLVEDNIQQWTVYFKKELSSISERLNAIEHSVLENNGSNVSKQISVIKRYVEKLRSIQEKSLDWQSEIAKGLNETASYADEIASSGNRHAKETKKLIETVGYNAKVQNHMQDWVSQVAKTTNSIAESVDHNAKMLNGINEWNHKISKAVNKLNEWGEEKAEAINGMHDWVSTQAKAINGINEWTESIAKNLNHTANRSEEMFGRAVSKEDAKRIIEYVELVSESKKNPELKQKIDEMLSKHGITEEQLNEASIKGISVLDTHDYIKTSPSKGAEGINKDVEMDPKTHTILARMKEIRMKKEGLPKGLSTLASRNDTTGKVGGLRPKGILTLDVTKTAGNFKKTSNKGDGPETKLIKAQNLKLNTDAIKNMNENLNKSVEIQNRASKLDNKLSRIIELSEKEREINESLNTQYPFTVLLSESDRERFVKLSMTDKQKVANEVSKVPTTDSEIILKLWESALSNSKNDEPLWLKAAPKKYRELYFKGPDSLKESIQAKSEFFNLETQYQIDNFWEVHSGLAKRPIILNENRIASETSSNPINVDPMVAAVGEAMLRYSN